MVNRAVGAGRPANALKEAGFTLLEVMIAVAIMLVAFSSILMVQSSSISSSIKSKQMNIVSMLAKSMMVETEYAFEGKTFDEFKKEEKGQFPAPYQDYSWKRVVREVKFPAMSLSGSASEKDQGAGEGQTQSVETLTKLITNFLSKAVREVTVTISWRRGPGEQNFSLSTYWVDLNHEFQLSE